MRSGKGTRMAKISDFWFRVEIDLELTRAEVEHLVTCSKVHYDHKCKAAAEYGGFIYGWRNHFDKDPNEPLTEEDLKATATVRATWHEMDLVCKILEVEMWHDQNDGLFLLIPFRGILYDMKAAAESANATSR